MLEAGTRLPELVTQSLIHTMKLYFREVGSPADPAIVLIHGVFGSSDNWFTVSKTIAEQGYRVLSVDQRNHGQSPRSDTHDYTGMAADLRGFLLDQQLEKPVLLGHSMGGKTVMQYAMDFPNTGKPVDYSKLVVVDIAPKAYPVHHTDIIRGLSAIDLASLKTRSEADTVLSQYESILPVRQFLLKNLYRTEEGQFAWRLNLPVIEREVHGIGDELTNTRPVTEPTLFIRGSESRYILDDDIPAIKRIFPSAIIETIQGASHWVHAEKPAEFVSSLVAFLNTQIHS